MHRRKQKQAGRRKQAESTGNREIYKIREEENGEWRQRSGLFCTLTETEREREREEGKREKKQTETNARQ